jgi:hypothetical protein
MKDFLKVIVYSVLFIAVPIFAFGYTVGIPPTQGPQLIDGTWAAGIANGNNRSYQSGITAIGSSQATALQLSGSVALIELDTVGASTGVALPQCLAGTTVRVYNASGTTVTIYPAIANNPNTAAQDTINAATSTTLATHVGASFNCAKDGNWFK